MEADYGVAPDAVGVCFCPLDLIEITFSGTNYLDSEYERLFLQYFLSGGSLLLLLLLLLLRLLLLCYRCCCCC